MLRSDPKAAWQGDESCVLMYPVYLRADRSKNTNPERVTGSPRLRSLAQHVHGHTIERSKLTVPRIERPRPAHHAAGRTGASEDLGQVRNAHPHLPVIFRRPNSPALMVHK